MINKDTTYERDVHKSYMKIQEVETHTMDEKLMLRKSYQGILSMEKCYVNGRGEYWYDISGKQALDVYCQGGTISRAFFEQLILRICDQLELLEWNLINSSCLVIDPEYIFVNYSGEEIFFVLYPDTSMDIYEQLQQLAEYVLTKLNHSNRDAVHSVYKIYEILLEKKYSIKDLKNAILEMRRREAEEIQLPITKEYVEKNTEPGEESNSDFWGEWKRKFQGYIDLARNKWKKKENIEHIPVVVYPQEEKEEEQRDFHPTVCLATTIGPPKGVLLYEGSMEYSDFQLKEGACVVGKNPGVELWIDRETVSQFHARIECVDGVYYIEDMNSTNGTFVNDTVLNYRERRELFSGDVIRFADVKYRFL